MCLSLLGLLIPFSFAFSTFLTLLTRFPLFFLPSFLVLGESISPFQLLRSFRLPSSLLSLAFNHHLPRGFFKLTQFIFSLRVEVSLPRNEQPQVVSMYLRVDDPPSNSGNRYSVEVFKKVQSFPGFPGTRNDPFHSAQLFPPYSDVLSQSTLYWA
jgi:hypothetical protein